VLVTASVSTGNMVNLVIIKTMIKSENNSAEPAGFHKSETDWAACIQMHDFKAEPSCKLSHQTQYQYKGCARLIHKWTKFGLGPTSNTQTRQWSLVDRLDDSVARQLIMTQPDCYARLYRPPKSASSMFRWCMQKSLLLQLPPYLTCYVPYTMPALPAWLAKLAAAKPNPKSFFHIHARSLLKVQIGSLR